MANNHENLVLELCFICGYVHRGTAYDVEEFKDDLEKTFNFTFEIVTGVTPIKFCNTCYRTVTMYKSKVEQGLKYETAKKVVIWNGHTSEGICLDCEQYAVAKRGGNRKKVKRKGREKVVGLWMDGDVPDADGNDYGFVKDLDPNHLRVLNSIYDKCLCVICCNVIINCPLVFKECEHGCCRHCFMSRFMKTPYVDTECPKCNMKSGIMVSTLIQSLVRVLRISCPVGCRKLVRFEEYNTHMVSCVGDGEVDQRKIADGLKTMFKEANSNYIEIKTGGQQCEIYPSINQPLCIMKTIKPRIDAASASISTIRKRSRDVEQLLSREAGHDQNSSTVLKRELVRRMPKDERAHILEDLNLAGRVITPEEGLAMFANLSWTWYTYRAWGRWMRSFGVKCPSEKKMRLTMGDWLTEQAIDAELTPFQHMKDKKTVMISAPMAYVKNPTQFIFSYLDMLADEGLLVQHGFMNNEIHIKFGGDHGMGSYKQSFQICNVTNPNSTLNTTVLNIFEAKDNKPNLKTALLQLQDAVHNLQTETWRGQKIRLFMFGDLAILYEMYGLSGASGRHNCLWCDVMSSELNLAPENRRITSKRTLEQLDGDFQNFKTVLQSDIKKAKDNRNVIDSCYFDVPLQQVVVPGLHITLGVYLKFFNLFELKCKELDYRLLHYLDGTEEDDAIAQVERLEEYVNRLEEGLITCGNTFNWQMIQLGDEDNLERNRLSAMYADHTTRVEEEKQRKERELHTLKKSNKMGVVGPTVKLIETVLQTKNVQRQSYHSQSFTGNHCHIMLKEANFKELCHSPVKMVSEHCPENTVLVATAYEIEENFAKLFGLFALCDKMYNSCDIVDVPLLESAITNLMEFFRKTWPFESVTPKMHILESHAVDFIRQWSVGFGFYGEQGGESIHKDFGKLHDNHNGMKTNPVNRLRSMVNKHHLRVSPKGRKLVPAVVPRK